MFYSPSHIIPAASFSDMNIHLITPTQKLNHWVQCLWQINNTKNTLHITQEKLYPDAGASLIFDIYPTEVQVMYFQQTQLCTYQWSGAATRISVRFAPGGAHDLLGIHAGELTHGAINIFDAPFINYAQQRCAELHFLREKLPTLKQNAQLMAVQSWLLSQIKYLKKPTIIPNLIQSSSANLLPLTEFAQRHGMHRRTLERQCQKQLGVSPKHIDQCYKIRHARHYLMNTTLSLADIALQCGYFDQAHFTNTFHAHTLETPKCYRQRKQASKNASNT